MTATLRTRIKKLLTDPSGVLQRRITSAVHRLRFGAGKKLRAEEYWNNRLSKFGFGLGGVGISGLSQHENMEMYLQAKGKFLSLCREQGVDFKTARTLEIGCGNGFYAEVTLEAGVKQYVGIDITDALFPKLNEHFHQTCAQFQKLDVATQQLRGEFDLIVMIDVTQHIVDDEKFYFAMQNIGSCLSHGGVFIVTSWLNDSVRKSFFEVSRSMEAYKQAFPDHSFSAATPFRDKFLFAIRKSKAPAG